MHHVKTAQPELTVLRREEREVELRAAERRPADHEAEHHAERQLHRLHLGGADAAPVITHLHAVLGGGAGPRPDAQLEPQTAERLWLALPGHLAAHRLKRAGRRRLALPRALVDPVGHRRVAEGDDGQRHDEDDAAEPDDVGPLAPAEAEGAPAVFLAGRQLLDGEDGQLGESAQSRE